MKATLAFEVDESEVDAFIDRLRARWPDLAVHVKSVRSVGEPECDDQFMEFWEVYPKKVAKKSALRCWIARLKEGTDPLRLIAAAKNYAAIVERESREEKYVLQPATFLGPNARWTEWSQVKEEKPYSPW